ncbi:MAG TPA: hypothetical protein VNT81_20125 [Vicinamibacterales bacterium]|nr:hypothetical protein [Vicinamibacterales bacterium]
MPVESALVIAAIILLVTVVTTIIFVVARQQKAREEELRSAAKARGWKFEKVHERGYRILRWSGTTDGITWVAESATFTSGGHKNQRRRHAGRWHGTYSPGINGAIVAMGLPKGKEELGKTIAEGDGFFARLAQKAAGFAFDKAIDVYFGDGPGKEVDAATMQRVDTRIPGFVVMAADKSEGTRIMQQGLEHALLDATSNKSLVLSDEDRPWILLRPHAVSLARMTRFHDANEIDSFVRAGVALTRAFRFGRAN